MTRLSVVNFERDQEREVKLKFSLDLFPYQDRPEIKTVRIVKRESERRQRDKDKVGMPMDSSFFDHMDEFKSDYLSAYRSDAQPFSENDSLTSDDQLFQPSISSKSKSQFVAMPKTSARVESALKNISSDLNPDDSTASDRFRGQTARHILSQISANLTNEQTAANNLRLADEFKRNLPRKKKRHNTAPNSVLNETYSDYLALRNSTKNVREPAAFLMQLYFTIIHSVVAGELSSQRRPRHGGGAANQSAQLQRIWTSGHCSIGARTKRRLHVA